MLYYCYHLWLSYIEATRCIVAAYVLRIDADTMNAIEAWAADEFRSTNGQLQWIIAEALRKSGRLKKKKKTENNEDQK